MRGNRRADTRPEQVVRSALHRRGLRFRKDYAIRVSDRRIRADIVFVRSRIAVFVDGCFWHGCPEHGNAPRVNTHYWGPKLARNIERDGEVTAALRDSGWTVLRFWEHERPEDVATTVLHTFDQLGGREVQSAHETR
jgi:DNA mismatch endonuclease (patch repair protein)